MSSSDMVNAPVPGGGAAAAGGGTVSLTANPLTVTVVNQQGETTGTGTTDIIPFAKSQPAGGSPQVVTH
jgi:hypothetical protein